MAAFQRARGRLPGSGDEGNASDPKRARRESGGQASTSAGFEARGGVMINPPQGGRPRMTVQQIVERRNERNRRTFERRGTLQPKFTLPSHLTSTKGKEGREITVVSNFFKCQSDRTWSLYEYHIDFTPEVESVKLRYELVNQHREKYGQCSAFNGANLVSAKKFLQDEAAEANWISKALNSQEEYKLRVRLVAEVAPNDPESIRLLDVVMRNLEKALELTWHRRDYFDPKAAIRLDRIGVEIWPGYSMTFIQCEKELLLNLDVVHAKLRMDNVKQMMKRICSNFRDDFENEWNRQLVGKVVLTKYNNKRHKIDGILKAETPLTTFEKNGKTISIKEYLESQYNLRIEDPKQPLLLTTPRKLQRRRGQRKEGESAAEPETRADKLVPELCYITTVDDLLKDMNVKREIDNVTRLSPGQRVERYRKFGTRVAQCDQAQRTLREWCINLSPEPLAIKGRVLSQPMLKDATTSLKIDGQTEDWSRSMRNFKALRGVGFEHYAVICPPSDEQLARDTVGKLQHVARGFGLAIGEPMYFRTENVRSDAYIRASKLAIDNTKDLRMVIAILPSKGNTQLYEAIKRTLCCLTPVPSQVLCVPTLRRDTGLSVATKVMLQICCKMGGSLWSVGMPATATDGMMICGMDWYKDSEHKDRRCGGFVANVDQLFSQFYTRSFLKKEGESFDQLFQCIVDATDRYAARTGKKPEKILMYRSGVAENQLRVVLELEVQQIRKRFQGIGNYNPRLAFVVVQKNIRPRFFESTRVGFANPPPGTVVDSTITRHKTFDFYIISQSVRQGTVSPTRYIVVHDDCQITPDDHQTIAYNLTHMYYNWSGTIRVVAPCHYAYKLSVLIARYLHKEPLQQLWDKLYYL